MTTRTRWFARAAAGAAAVLVTGALSLPTASAATHASVAATRAGAVAVGACPAAAIPAHHTVAGHSVGETACDVSAIDTVPDVAGRPWSEATVALSGTAAGYVETAGAPRSDLVDYPRLLFPQFGDISWAPATTTYSGSTPGAGNGLSVLWPDNPANWNGQVLVLVPGEENVPPINALVPRTGKGLDPQTFTNLYAGPAIDAGYAVIYVRRQADNGLTAALDGGGTVDTSLNDNVATAIDWIHTGEALLEQALGRSPSTTLWYGHSSGVILGRLVNWSGANVQSGGGKVVDGFFSDDPGGGLPLPLDLPEGQLLGYRNGKVTYAPGSGLTRAERTQLTPELTFAHTEYVDSHPWEPKADYLALKRAGELAYEKQGLTKLTRFYEVAGVSHIANQVGSPPKTLDLEGLWQAGLSDLDAWVRRGATPPKNLADLKAGNDQPALGKAVDLPPIACPTGFRYGGPVGGSDTETGYAAYDGTSLEPITNAGALVDVNGDGYRDTMPTIDQAWQSLHLIGAHQHVTQPVYVSCVRQDVRTLERDRLLDPVVGSWYVQQSQRYPDVPW